MAGSAACVLPASCTASHLGVEGKLTEDSGQQISKLQEQRGGAPHGPLCVLALTRGGRSLTMSGRLMLEEGIRPEESVPGCAPPLGGWRVIGVVAALASAMRLWSDSWRGWSVAGSPEERLAGREGPLEARKAESLVGSCQRAPAWSVSKTG